jgi:hypothetical protein
MPINESVLSYMTDFVPVVKALETIITIKDYFIAVEADVKDDENVTAVERALLVGVISFIKLTEQVVMQSLIDPSIADDAIIDLARDLIDVDPAQEWQDLAGLGILPGFKDMNATEIGDFLDVLALAFAVSVIGGDTITSEENNSRFEDADDDDA